MFVRRLAISLKQQHWMTIVIELIIVILGVFIGNWVNDWNQARAERRDTNAIVRKLGGDIDRQLVVVQANRAYYATTDRYAAIAFAGWARDPAVSDRDFVIAAYQASQVVSFISGGPTYTMLLGGDQVRKIGNERLRDAIVSMLTYDPEPISRAAVRSRYRDDVRAVVPDAVQTAIRRQCGDTVVRNGVTELTPNCDMIAVSASDAATGAHDLRAHPELIGELRQHRAQTATYLSNVDSLGVRMTRVQTELKRAAR
ncbi:MAG: hypothetical protein ABIW33_08280 [Sphingomicrobium sp.]